MKHHGYLYIDVAAGARKQEWTGLLAGVEFRDCGDHMFWTRKIPLEALMNDCLLELYLHETYDCR